MEQYKFLFGKSSDSNSLQWLLKTTRTLQTFCTKSFFISSQADPGPARSRWSQLRLVPGQRHLRLHLLIWRQPSVGLLNRGFALFLPLHFLLLFLLGCLLTLRSTVSSLLLSLLGLALSLLSSLLLFLFLLVLCDGSMVSLFLPVIPILIEAS